MFIDSNKLIKHLVFKLNALMNTHEGKPDNTTSTEDFDELVIIYNSSKQGKIELLEELIDHIKSETVDIMKYYD